MQGETQSKVAGMEKGLRAAPPEVIDVARRLVMRDFPHLAQLRIAILVRDTVLEGEEGQVSVAATGVSTTPEKDPFDCIFWFAWDVWQLLTDLEREAIVYHEFKHCDHDDMGHGELAPHDASVFNDEVRKYGVWWERPAQVYKELRSRMGERE